MTNRLLITLASAALIGAGGIAFAQAPGGGNSPAAAPSAPAASQSAPAQKAAPMNRGEGAESRGASDAMKGGRAEQNAPRENGPAQRAQDGSADGMKSKGANSETTKPSIKANDNAASDKGDTANPKNAASDNKPGTTTGQAGAGAKLSTEQRSTIRTSITKQNIKPVTNVNFSISVGTRVPRGVAFHPLPVEVISIYPDWRGYEFILVGDQIVVVNPRTLEIVAVLDA